MNKVEDVLNVGDNVKVKVIEVDDRRARSRLIVLISPRLPHTRRGRAVLAANPATALSVRGADPAITGSARRGGTTSK